MIEGFQVYRRNHGHWDISSKGNRLFRIRGEPGAYVVMDERARPYPVTPFVTVSACMMFICEILMYENLQLHGSAPVVIDRCGNPVRPNAATNRPPSGGPVQ